MFVQSLRIKLGITGHGLLTLDEFLKLIPRRGPAKVFQQIIADERISVVGRSGDFGIDGFLQYLGVLLVDFTPLCL